MLLEFPFNLIPMDWPMLIFVELLFTLYIFINFLMVSFETDHTNVYEAFDWYDNPFKAIAAVIVCYMALALIFALFWYFSQKCKLPSYERRHGSRFESSFTGRSEMLDDANEDDDEIEHEQ